MMNNINNNPHSRNTYGQGNLNDLNNNNQVQNTDIGEKNLNQQQQNPLKNLEILQKSEVEQFLRKIQQEIEKAQLISIKIVRGEKPTQKELNFIKSKYPDMKQIAEESKKECNNLKEILKYCKTDKEVEILISNKTNDIYKMIKDGTLSEAQAKIKTSAVDEVIKFSEKLKVELKKAEVIAIKFIKGEKLNSSEEQFIKQKYPELKKVVDESLKESNALKGKLKKCNTQEQKQQLISRVIRDIDDKYENGIFTKIEVKVKMVALEEAINYSKKDETQLRKAELIATKIIKGEKLTNSQKQFINENYPDIKEMIEKSVKEYKYLKEELKNCNSDEQKQQVLKREINDVDDMTKRGTLSQIHSRIKMSVIEVTKEDEEKKDRDKENNLLFYLNPYMFLSNGGLVGKIGISIIIIVIASIIYIF